MGKKSLLSKCTVPLASDGNENASECEGTPDGYERPKPAINWETFVGRASTTASKAATVASSTARQSFELAKGKFESVRRATTAGLLGQPVATPPSSVPEGRLTAEQKEIVHVLVDLGMSKEKAQHAVCAGLAETLVEAAFAGHLGSALLQIEASPSAPTFAKQSRFDVKRRVEAMFGRIFADDYTPQSPFLAVGRQHMLLEEYSEFTLERVLEESRLEAEYEQALKLSTDDVESSTDDVRDLTHLGTKGNMDEAELVRAGVPLLVPLEPDLSTPEHVLVERDADQGIRYMRNFRHVPSVGTWLKPKVY